MVMRDNAHQEKHLFDHAIPPEQMTEACARYFSDQDELVHLNAFIATMAMNTDEVARRAASVLYEASQDEDEKAKLAQALEKGQSTRKALKAHSQLQLEMVLCRTVDGFFIYVSDLLADIHRTRPETLKSGDTVRVDLVLEQQSMDDLFGMLADRKVAQLSYQGTRDVAKYVNERLGLSLFEDANELDRAVRIVEIRNLIVHSRGRINRTFLARARQAGDALGERIDLDIEGVLRDNEFLSRAVVALDIEAATKFGVRTPVSRSDYQWSMYANKPVRKGMPAPD